MSLSPEAWSCRFWMGKFGSSSPKPHVVYSNDRGLIFALSEFAGYMSRAEQQTRCPERTCRTYLDKQGVKRSQGKKQVMKESQPLG